MRARLSDLAHVMSQMPQRLRDLWKPFVISDQVAT
jgi:hypothetical protein